MKKIALTLIAASCVVFSSCGKYSNKFASDFLMDIPTTQSFSSEQVKEDDLTKILTAGINCQSGMNAQPWHFSVIRNRDVLSNIAEEMQKNMPAGIPENVRKKDDISTAPVAIVISGKLSSEFDCALATQVMACEAGVLGYGTKILGSPNIVFHGEKKEEYKKLFKIPSNMETVAVLLVGKDAGSKSDAVSSASLRKSFSETVSVIE